MESPSKIGLAKKENDDKSRSVYSMNKIRITIEQQINDYLSHYEVNKSPIEVNFRKLVYWFRSQERATHLIHPYPAKLLMHIPHFFLANNVFSKPGDVVLDPFCGSGTVLLEAILLGRNAIGCDCNPLACKIAEAKTKTIDINSFFVTPKMLKDKLKCKNSTKVDFPDVVNINYWFLPHIIDELTRILCLIEDIGNPDEKLFYQICFSNCVRKVSLTDPYIMVPVHLNPNKYPEGHKRRQKCEKKLAKLQTIDVVEEFFCVVEQNRKRYSTLRQQVAFEVASQAICCDARKLKQQSVGENDAISIPSDSIDLVITSPPYGGAQKYVRSASLNLGWLKLCSVKGLKKIEDITLGREHYLKERYCNCVQTGIKDADALLEIIFQTNPLRSYIVGNYLLEMRLALEEIVRVLKPGGYFILVTANNKVCGYDFPTHDFLKTFVKEMGLSLVLELIDHIASRGLMTKRNATASVITREWVYVFRK